MRLTQVIHQMMSSSNQLNILPIINNQDKPKEYNRIQEHVICKQTDTIDKYIKDLVICLEVNETVSQALRKLTLGEEALMEDNLSTKYHKKKKQKNLSLSEINAISNQDYSK
ncbi:hypothetical protein cand_014970 [Cryptosporidium andersoni]|uniref:Uncharacterized protein n=1 Tax=Cryptosporidium andersoni TaxID=117008 RepID=A0A1J4MTU7_9CRYT|nr:hypothetical protein cand_014970 [Cryptosporidium andersoni]